MEYCWLLHCLLTEQKQKQQRLEIKGINLSVRERRKKSIEFHNSKEIYGPGEGFVLSSFVWLCMKWIKKGYGHY